MENNSESELSKDQAKDTTIKVITRLKQNKEIKRSQKPKVPQLELRVFDHSFPYGLSLPSDVIKQVSRITFNQICLHFRLKHWIRNARNMRNYFLYIAGCSYMSSDYDVEFGRRR